MKKISLATIILSATILACGCEVTVKPENDGHKAVQEAIESEKEKQFDYVEVREMAQVIYTDLYVYFTECQINGDTVSDNLTYEDLVDKLVDCGMPAEYKTYNLDVSWEYDAETLSVKKVTVTVDGKTETYGE